MWGAAAAATACALWLRAHLGLQELHRRVALNELVGEVVLGESLGDEPGEVDGEGDPDAEANGGEHRPAHLDEKDRHLHRLLLLLLSRTRTARHRPAQ